jgi:stress response protein YsnF
MIRIVSETVQVAVTIRREELVIERSVVEGAPAGDPSSVQAPRS